MHDTDPFDRPPFFTPPPIPAAAKRKRSPRVVESSFLDKTPTTAPITWEKPPVATRLPRIARGTSAPIKVRAASTAVLDEALERSAGVRPAQSEGPWGWVRRVDLDVLDTVDARDPSAVAVPAPPPPRPLITPAPIVAVLALIAAYFAVLLALPSPSRPAAASWETAEARPLAAEPTVSPIGKPVVTPLPPEPTVEPIVVEPIVEPAPARKTATAAPPRAAAKKKEAAPKVAPAKVVIPPVPTPSVPAVSARGDGVLMVSSKPPCRILVDGRDTGRTTPVRDLRLSVGTHEITLVNDEYGIRETATVEIGDKPARLVRNLLPE